MSIEKLQRVLEYLNNKVEALKVSYLLEGDGGGVNYYFYYNQKHDPVIIETPEGECPENQIGVTLPSSVHQDLDLRPHSTVTESQLEEVIKAYRILTENQLRKNVSNGRVVRKRVKTITKPQKMSTLKNRVDGKKASLFSKTAAATVKRKRSNNVRDILNLDKQPKGTKENSMTTFDFNRRVNKLQETYCTYPQARSMAIDIMNTLVTKKLPSYNIKYPNKGTAVIDQRGFSIDWGGTNKKYMAKESMEDYIAKDILARFSRGENLDSSVTKLVTLKNPQ